ncbi:hypothetical protein F183_A02650 [Bryobacterales bacterium F-183]|nr:hypothetical protein F183_A02650 [Bryobacterales bacterium F-183]
MGIQSDYLTFQISGRYFAVPRTQVREMMPIQPLLPGRGSGDNLIGMLYSHGREIPVFDVRGLLQVDNRTSRRGCFLVLGSPSGLEFAIPVDKVTDCISVSPQDISRGVITGHGRVRSVVDSAQLVGQDAILGATFSSSSTSRP